MKYEVKMTGTKVVNTKMNGEKIFNTYEVGDYEVEESVYYKGTDLEYRVYRVFDLNVSRTFHPDIIARNTIDEERVDRFEVQTTSYGSLEVVDMKQMIEAYTEAMNVAQALNDKFCKCRYM